MFRPTIETGTARFIWLGTRKVFDAFTFVFEETQHGVVQAHCYPYSTRRVHVHRRDGRRRPGGGPGWTPPGRYPPGESDEAALAFAEDVFGAHFDGEGVIGNNSMWRTFPTVRCERWHDGRVVLLGDAAHTAHFSVGSGTKLAMEDAIVLADVLAGASGPTTSRPPSTATRTDRQPAAASLQRAADTLGRSGSPRCPRYVDMPTGAVRLPAPHPVSQRITYDNLRLRDAELMDRIRHWFWKAPARRPIARRSAETPPMFYPFRCAS